MQKIFKTLAVIACFILAMTASESRADTLAPARAASGPADDTLCGIGLYTDKLQDVMRKLNRIHLKRKFVNEMNYTVYVWKKGTLEIEVTFDDSSGLNSIIASGSDPEKFCKTKRGLALGDSYETVKKFYGPTAKLAHDNKDSNFSFAEWEENGRYVNTIYYSDSVYVEMRFSSSLKLKQIFLHGDLE